MQQLLDVVTQGGVIGILVLIIAGGARQWWVWGWHYRIVVKDRDEWKRMALRNTVLAERATDAAIGNGH